ncbi:MAG: GNAT family protein [Clostridia bacterium]|nr:GNAT family protein [Clostridia bacterium]
MEIVTKRLVLRPITQADAADMFEYSKHPSVGPNAGWKPHESIEETRKLINTLFLGKDWLFGIVLSGKLIGTVGMIGDTKRENKNVRMLGYAMGYNYWGNGYMTEAAGALIKRFFAQTDFEAVTCCCYTFNERSQRVIEKLGFVFEGILHMAEMRYDGQVFDMKSYILTRSEYDKKI